MDPSTKENIHENFEDIFRFENGKIVEHWDVVQAVPEKTANGNTMFEGSNEK